jgi:adenylate cyclase
MALLRARRHDVLMPAVARHGGRIFKFMGDGVLIEFTSVVNAVECAIDLQDAMKAQNADLPADQHILLRIGINLGDVIVEGSDLYGDGVNLAARLESLAEPGGICVSGDVYRQVRSKLQMQFQDLGEQKVKNIVGPVHAYRVQADGAGAGPMESPDTDRSAAALPKKLSIAVLPFANMSGDPGQEYFSDGLTEDIITELSRFRDLLVIARNSSFAFKGQAVDVKEVGRKLGARHVLEGSVRRVGNRVRITAQLLETAAGNHLWAERYDRDLEDIFSVQDELVRAITGAIPGQLDRHAVEKLRRTPPDNLTAFDCELRGRWALRHWNEDLSIALEWFAKAIKADPNYALAHAGIAMAYCYGLYILGLPPEEILVRAKEHAQRAIALDDTNPTTLAYAAFTYNLLAAEYKLARNYAERALALNPNDPFVLFVQASTLLYAGGEPKKALQWFEKSERIEPYTTDDYRFDILEDCYYTLGDYEKVIGIHDVHRLPAFSNLVLAAAFAQTGQIEKAKLAVEEYEQTRPAGHDAATFIQVHVRMCARQEDRDRWLEGYRKAGLPV